MKCLKCNGKGELTYGDKASDWVRTSDDETFMEQLNRRNRTCGRCSGTGVEPDTDIYNRRINDE